MSQRSRASTCRSRAGGCAGRSQAWRRGYPAELLGPQEQSGGGVRLVLRLAWDVAGAAGLRLAAQGGAVA
jgi:hypothetical protein